MSFLLGLTGSVGMGKSTTARIFANRGYPVWDADETVHLLYAQGGPAVAPIAALCPGAIIDGAVDRAALTAWIARDANALQRIESVVHPLVAENRAQFIASAKSKGVEIIVLDIPLLFETGAHHEVDGVAVVSTDAATQSTRVLARPGMTPQAFTTILSRQMPDVEKRALADWVIPTDTPEAAQAAVDAICRDIHNGKHA